MDTVSKKKRSEIMRAVKSRDSKMEIALRKVLSQRKLRYKTNVARLPGKPDIAFTAKKLVIFLDSCFWHGCRWHGTIPASNRKFWVQKITRNKERDKAISTRYKRVGWRILRFWGHELKRNQNMVVAAIVAALKKPFPSTRLSIYEKVKTTKK